MSSTDLLRDPQTTDTDEPAINGNFSSRSTVKMPQWAPADPSMLHFQG